MPRQLKQLCLPFVLCWGIFAFAGFGPPGYLKLSPLDLILLLVAGILAVLLWHTRTALNVLKAQMIRHTADLDEKNKTLNAHNRELETLDEIVKDVNRELETQQVFDSLLQRGRVLFPMATRAVLLLCREDGIFYPAAAWGYEPGTYEYILMSREEVMGRYTAGESWGGGIYIIRGLYDLPAASKLSHLSYHHSMLCMRLDLEDKVAGFLVWDADGEQSFDRNDVRRLTRFSHHVASAVAKARFMEALKARNEAVIDAQNQLIVQEKMATLGTLTAGVAHEFNNPNNVIFGGAQNLEHDIQKFKTFLFHLAGEMEDELEREIDKRFVGLVDHVELIKKGSVRIGEIVSSLRLVTRHNETPRKRVDLLSGLRATVSLLDSQYDTLSIQLELGDPIEREVFPAELSQVYLNLLLNACQAVEDRVMERKEPAGLLRISSSVKNGHVRIEFRDNGPGISPDIADRIFEPFFTTRAVGKGRGLGLYSAWRIMEKHGGHIELTHTSSEGSVFTLHFPPSDPNIMPH